MKTICTSIHIFTLSGSEGAKIWALASLWHYLTTLYITFTHNKYKELLLKFYFLTKLHKMNDKSTCITPLCSMNNCTDGYQLVVHTVVVWMTCNFHQRVLLYPGLMSLIIWPTNKETYSNVRTRKHSSMMHTARLETVCASVSVATTRCHSGDPQMNKFKQVFSDHHQMSLVGGVEYWIHFEWNKHRCTYVHWRIYSSRDLDTLLHKVDLKILYESYTGIYTHTTIACPKWEMLLEVLWHAPINRITIAWETVNCEN